MHKVQDAHLVLVQTKESQASSSSLSSLSSCLQIATIVTMYDGSQQSWPCTTAYNVARHVHRLATDIAQCQSLVSPSSCDVPLA